MTLETKERLEFLDVLVTLADLPPHDPDRYETVDGFDNPGCTNSDRAGFARAALLVFRQVRAVDDDTDILAADLICDLLHLVHAHHFDPLETLRDAAAHFAAEAGKLSR